MRTTVVVPEGVQTALEEQLEARYGLREAIVVEVLDDTEAGITREEIAQARRSERDMPGAFIEHRRPH